MAVLLAFKIVTITLVFMAAYPSENLVAMLLAMNWPWLIVLGLLLSVIPAGYWYRLIRLRARRKQLQRSEWNVS